MSRVILILALMSLTVFDGKTGINRKIVKKHSHTEQDKHTTKFYIKLHLVFFPYKGVCAVLFVEV